ncbi:Maff2 family protein [Butyricicoccus faecihominis]|nr:Maff2 family protein [Butyricicoccus faecihominis]MCQ5129496.1 Maff2 family protein [Butyricicoccus faecihominis]
MPLNEAAFFMPPNKFCSPENGRKRGFFMDFFNSAVDVLQTIVVGLGGALCVWGGVNLLEGYGQDNPASNAHVR